MNKKKNKKSNVIKEEKSKRNKFDIINYKKNYKFLMIIPLILFILSVISIINTISTEGTPIYRDVSLKGGLSAIIYVDSDVSSSNFENYLNSKFKDNSFKVSELFEKGVRTGFIVDTDLDEDEFIKTINKFFNTKFTSGDNYMSNYISPSLSDSFFTQSMYILGISFLLMSIVIFAYFRELVPAGAVVLSAIFDIIVTIGILDYFNVQVSIAGIGALLMLIGYSIDTDVLLTNRLVREEGRDYFDKVFFAFKTGSLMSITTLVAGIAALFLTNSGVIYEIALILVIGLLVDFISTWLQNTGILLWWINNREE